MPVKSWSPFALTVCEETGRQLRRPACLRVIWSESRVSLVATLFTQNVFHKGLRFFRKGRPHLEALRIKPQRLRSFVWLKRVSPRDPVATKKPQAKRAPTTNQKEQVTLLRSPRNRDSSESSCEAFRSCFTLRISVRVLRSSGYSCRPCPFPA